MPNRLPFLSIRILLAAVALFALTTPAFAGFMLVQPTDSGGSALAPVTVPPSPYAGTNSNGAVTTMPLTGNYGSSTTISSSHGESSTMATQKPEPLTPVIIDGSSNNDTEISNARAPASPSPAPSMASPASQELAPKNLGTVEMPNHIRPMTTSFANASASSPSSSSSSSSDVVHGFAKMVPLAVALRQILPPGYGFSVDPDVDLGVLISFQGGKPWRETLQAALDPAGLVMREKGQMVSIGHVDGSTTSAGMPNTIPSAASAEPVLQPGLAAPQAATQAATQTAMPQPAIRTIAPPPVPHEIATQSGSVLVNNDAVPMTGMPGYSNSMTDTWRAERGDSLRRIMDGWCRRANVELDWMAEYDYPVQATINYTGTFEEAVRNILTGFQDAHPQPIGELHTNPALGQRVLVVQTRGNNYTN